MTKYARRTSGVVAAIGIGLLFSACGGEKPEESAGEESGAAAATGDTITIEMHTDATGNYFKPNDVDAERGDVLRFVLVSGVHNVNFLPDSNSVRTGLPPASDMLQLPGQTHDIVVSLGKGDYYFQCDPHAALGMVGRLEVED